MIKYILHLIFAAGFLPGCYAKEKPLPQMPRQFQTRNVIIVVVDGPRYSETWGDPDKKYIPELAQNLSKEGVVNTRFFNSGPTYTNAGHAAITTGVYQQIDNKGHELPKKVSIFQRWREVTGKPAEKAWIVASKDKLHILADTRDDDYKGKFLPRINCGNNGPETGHRQDSTTLRIAKQVLNQHQPNLMLINFKEPDASGHAGNWEGYLEGIRTTDAYVWQLWQFIQQHPAYRDQTTLILTNDHGRHKENHRNEFVSHGDKCSGCKHINFFAAGPDFKRNAIISETYNQTDISATVARLLGFEMQTSDGEIMWELFRE